MQIRRAGARCLRALVGCRPELIEGTVEAIVNKLIRRFAEREVSVRVDVLGAFDEIVRQVSHMQERTPHTELPAMAALKVERFLHRSITLII